MEADIKYLINQGKNYFKNQAYKNAETIFLKIIGNKCEFADVYNMLGVIYHQTGQYSKAITHFQKALKINPRYTEAMLNLSVLYNDLGEYKLSKQLLKESKQQSKKGEDTLDPFIKGKVANKHAETGDLYRGIGLYHLAIDEYKKGLEFAPHYYDIRNKLGVCFREEGKKAEAIREFQKIIKEKPSFSDAYIQLGLTLHAQNNKHEARKVWMKLSSINPKHELVRMYLRLSDAETKAGKKKK
ncbi:MAG TPA: hypothetical protein DDW49_03970 [Deltaproteobacteria bacterium]|nr:MAG: hypothetical protein A2048_02530 [Deltaproteobacteria bacterium GWA2_45_12]HBF12536.1 hypothetical protein [Deltaproteobacteria bacterium]